MGIDKKLLMNAMRLSANNNITSARQLVLMCGIALKDEFLHGDRVNVSEMLNLYSNNYVYITFRETLKGASVLKRFVQWTDVNNTYLTPDGAEFISALRTLFDGLDPDATFEYIKSVFDAMLAKKLTKINHVALLIAMHDKPNQHYSFYTNGNGSLIESRLFSPLQEKKLIVNNTATKTYFLEPSTDRLITRLLKSVVSTKPKVETPTVNKSEFLDVLVSANQRNIVGLVELSYGLQMSYLPKGLPYGKHKKEILSNIISETMFLTKHYGHLKLSIEGYSVLNLVLSSFSRNVKDNAAVLVKAIRRLSKAGLQTVEEGVLVVAINRNPGESLDWYMKQGFWNSSTSALLQFIDRCDMIHVGPDDGAVSIDPNLSYHLSKLLGFLPGESETPPPPPPPSDVTMPVEEPETQPVVAEEPVVEPKPAEQYELAELAESMERVATAAIASVVHVVDTPSQTIPHTNEQPVEDTVDMSQPKVENKTTTLAIEIQHKDSSPTVLNLPIPSGKAFYTRLETHPDGSTKVVIVEV